jgi:hypothetical protein
MKATLKIILGCFLFLTGLLTSIFSHPIVFPGLEKLLGIETIVGKNSVDYQPDGSYYYTNPAAQAFWTFLVAAIGGLIAAFGIWLLARAKKVRDSNPTPWGSPDLADNV